MTEELRALASRPSFAKSRGLHYRQLMIMLLCTMRCMYCTIEHSIIGSFIHSMGSEASVRLPHAVHVIHVAAETMASTRRDRKRGLVLDSQSLKH